MYYDVWNWGVKACDSAIPGCKLSDHVVDNNDRDIFLITETLKHVASTVAGCKLSDHIVEVVFTLFDENGKCTLASIIWWSSHLTPPQALSLIAISIIVFRSL